MIGVQLKEQRFAVKISKQDYQYYITSNSLGSSRRLPGISLCSNKYKTKNLDVLNTCSSVNRVVLIEAGSLIQTRSQIEDGGSDTIVLIEAGGFY